MICSKAVAKNIWIYKIVTLEELVCLQTGIVVALFLRSLQIIMQTLMFERFAENSVDGSTLYKLHLEKARFTTRQIWVGSPDGSIEFIGCGGICKSWPTNFEQ